MNSMMEHIESLYSGLQDFKEDLTANAKNMLHSCLFSFSVGFSYRMILNGLSHGNNGLTRVLLPYDEILRPPLVYLALFAVDWYSRRKGWVNDSSPIRKYAPHALILTGCVGWEYMEYTTPLPDLIPILGPNAQGTGKDLGMAMATAATARFKYPSSGSVD